MGSKKVSPESLVDHLLDEWKRSMLTFWVLCLLMQRSMYGLELKKEIESSTQGKLKLGASTVYQLLRRMEKHGLVTSHWEKNYEGPPRAYYEPTPAGQEVTRRYASEVFSPDSPIAAALAQLVLQIQV